MGYLLNKIQAAKMARVVSGELRMVKLDCPSCGEANWFEPDGAPTSLEECAACGWKVEKGGFVGKSEEMFLEEQALRFVGSWSSDLLTSEAPIEIHWTREGGMIPVSREEHQTIHSTESVIKFDLDGQKIAESAASETIPLFEYFLNWLDRPGGPGAETFQENFHNNPIKKISLLLFEKDSDLDCWISEAFAWKLTPQGYDYWMDENVKWHQEIVQLESEGRLLPNKKVKI